MTSCENDRLNVKIYDSALYILRDIEIERTNIDKCSCVRSKKVTLNEVTVDLIKRFVDICIVDKTLSLITWPSLNEEANMIKEASDENGKP